MYKSSGMGPQSDCWRSRKTISELIQACTSVSMFATFGRSSWIGADELNRAKD